MSVVLFCYILDFMLCVKKKNVDKKKKTIRNFSHLGAYSKINMVALFYFFCLSLWKIPEFQ